MKSFFQSGNGWWLVIVGGLGILAAGHLGLISITDAIKAAITALAVAFFIYVFFMRPFT